MNRIRNRLTTAFVAAASLCPLLAGAAEKPKAQRVSGKINWVYDYGQGQRSAQAAGKPMFVVFRCER